MLGFNEHLSDVHGGCRVVYPSEDDDLLEEQRCDWDIGDSVYISITQNCSMEFVG